MREGSKKKDMKQSDTAVSIYRLSTGILIVKGFTLQTKGVVFPSIIRDENCFYFDH